MAVQGVLDLRQWDLTRDGAVRLDGEWSFFWDQSKQSLTETSPRETVKVPGNWLQNGHPTKGKAVYRLRILTQPGSQVFGLKLYEFPHSYRLYANGQQIIENGKYAETPLPSGRSLVRPYVVFAATSETLDLLIESVNLDDAEPGPRRSIIFGLEPQVRRVQDNQLMADVMVTGVLLIMALYHLALYLQRRSEMGSLLFGLLCWLMILRIAVTEEHYLHKYFPQFPGGIERTLDVFSFFAMVPMFTWIYSYFFRQEFHPWVHKSVTTVFVLFSAVYLLVPTAALFGFNLRFTLAVGLYLLYVLLRGVKHRHAESGVFLLGFLLLVATSVWDMLSYSNIVRTVYISHFGFIAFIFAQAYVLSMRFNQALFTSEKLTLNLESVVAQRTSALEESNRRLALLNITDALTGIANRRHFDDMLGNEWSRAQRNQRPLALLMLDIDNFKAYNDHHGHQGGDACLQTVATILSATIHRAGDTLARYGGVGRRCNGQRRRCKHGAYPGRHCGSIAEICRRCLVPGQAAGAQPSDFGGGRNRPALTRFHPTRTTPPAPPRVRNLHNPRRKSQRHTNLPG